MKIQNLKAVPDAPASAPAAEPAILPAIGPAGPAALVSSDKHVLEVAVLKARIQHLELVIEMARSLLGSNQERLLRRLHDVPRELATLSTQLQRVDPEAVW